MTIISGRTTVTTIAQIIVPSQYQVGGCTLVVQNLDNNSSVFIDGENVTPQNGFELKKGASISLPLSPVESLYAITQSGTVQLCYLATGR